jgi:hypothetical protein
MFVKHKNNSNEKINKLSLYALIIKRIKATNGENIAIL